MMRFPVVVALCFFGFSTQAQWGISLDLNVGKYKLEDVKQLHEREFQILKQSFSTLSIEKIENFSMWFSPQLTGSYTFGRYTVGVYGSYHTTGGRISYEDYSGIIQFDNIVEGYFTGIYQRYMIANVNDHTSLNGSLRGGIGFSSLTSDHTIHVYETQYDFHYENKYKTKQFGVEPGIELVYSFGKNISARLNAAYHLQVYAEKFEYPKTMIWWYPPVNAKLDWTGIRMGLGCEIRF